MITPSEKRTVCAYKGVASYFSADGGPDVAWSYREPLHDALPVKDMLCFWRAATVYVDGEAVDTSMPGENEHRRAQPLGRKPQRPPSLTLLRGRASGVSRGG